MTSPPLTRPQRPRRTSRWVIAGAVIALFAANVILHLAESYPLEAVMASVAFVVVAPILYWLGRPSFVSLRSIGALLLWGSVAAVTIAAVTEALAAATLALAGVHSDAVSAIAVAPPIEETCKLLGLVVVGHYGARSGRLRVDGALDGIVAAGWVGIGFAVVEDLFYLITAAHSGALTTTFLLRDLVTPFGHPLFASLAGVGYAAYRRRGRRRYLAIGLVAAASAHATFNTLATVAPNQGTNLATDVLIGVMATLWLSVYISAVVLRRRRSRANLSAAWASVARQPLLPASSVADLHHQRATVPEPAREDFDALAGAAVRLSVLNYSDDARERLLRESRDLIDARWPAGPVPGWYRTALGDIRWWDGRAWRQVV